MVEPSLLEQVLGLSVEDRNELMHKLANSLSTDDAGLTPAMITLAEERLADLEANPDDFQAWEEVRQSLFSK